MCSRLIHLWLQVFVLLHWFLQAEDISDVVGYEEADMYVNKFSIYTVV
jgi:hypothetical protein